MRFISLGYRKVKAVQCYIFLLIWLIIVSIGSCILKKIRVQSNHVEEFSEFISYANFL